MMMIDSSKVHKIEVLMKVINDYSRDEDFKEHIRIAKERLLELITDINKVSNDNQRF